MRYPSNALTVVFRDDGPMIHCDDTPSYRSVRITLTDEQVRALAMHETHSVGGTRYHESISRCFIEPSETKGDA